MTKKVIDEKLLGDLYDNLTWLLKEKSDRALVNREIARLIEHYGFENVRDTLLTIKEDIESSK